MPITKRDDGTYDYLPPITANDEYFRVPIVIKNKDSLVAFCEGVWALIDFLGEDVTIKNSHYLPAMFLSSSRFTDYTDEGIRLSDMDGSELVTHTTESVMKTKLQSIYMEQKGPVDFSEYFLTVECHCGNFIGFKNPKDIPSVNVSCDLCDRTLIEYINIDDDLVMYEGVDPDHYETLINLITENIDSKIQEDEEDEEDLEF